MARRVKVAFWVSLILPLVALSVLMLRAFDPYTRPVAYTLYALGWVLFIAALSGSARVRQGVSERRGAITGWWQTWQRAVITALALGAIGVLGIVLLPVGHSELDELPVTTLAPRIDADLTELEREAGKLNALRARVAPLFAAGNLDNGEAKATLAGAWAGYYDNAVVLDQWVNAYKFFYRINPIKHEGLNSRSFLIAYTALVLQVRHGLVIVNSVGNNRNLETWLDEAHPEFGLASRSYFQFRQGLTRPDTLTRMNAGFAYLKLLDKAGRLSGDREQRLVALAEENYGEAMLALGKEPEVVADNPLDYFEATAFLGWFPLQKAIAVGMSEIRTTGRENFVSDADVATAYQKLEPGDVLLERRNWYLTNVGLPGFWPHAAYYTGSLEDLDKYFTGEDVLQVTEGQPPSQYLKAKFPEAFAKYQANCEHDPCRVIEAVGEGVILNSLEHSARADYLAALRPKQSKADKLNSLLRAYSHFGKPYDYDFDFVTDTAIVCSELVYKCVQPVGERQGVTFNLVTTSGRLVLPPNNIIRKFDEEYGKPEAQLDFVLFFDGNEEQQRAIERGVDELRASWRRPKWDVAQP
jgi:hypothetical protein